MNMAFGNIENELSEQANTIIVQLKLYLKCISVRNKERFYERLYSVAQCC